MRIFRQLLTTFLFLLFYVSPVTSQPFLTADEAFCNPICDWGVLNGFTYTLPNSNIPNPLGFPDGCGGVLNNPSWFSFVAAGGGLNVTVSPSNCIDVGNGGAPNLDVQMALYEIDAAGCPTPNVFNAMTQVRCATGCGASPQVITWNNIQTTRGQQYLLVVDGCSGDVCDLEFEANGPGAQPFVLGEITDINGAASEDTLYVCTGVTGYELFVNGDIGYQTIEWTLPDLSVQQFTTLSLTQNYPLSGDFRYCAEGFTGCDSTEQFCVIVKVRPAPPGEREFINLCEGESTNWMGSNYNATGDYQAIYQDPVSQCRYDTFLTLYVHDENNTNPTMIDTTGCFDDVINIGPLVIDRYNNTGDFTIPSATYPACDSFLTVNAVFLNATANISDVTCSFGDFIIFLEDIMITPPDGTNGVTYDIEWRNGNGDVVSNTDQLITPIEDDYTVYITVNRNNVSCEIVIDDFTINRDDFLPNDPAFIDGLLTSCGTGVFEYSTPDIPNADSYQWTTTAGTIVSGQGTDVIMIDWTGTTGGIVCVKTVNSCGESVGELCEEVRIVDSPTSTFNLPSPACVADVITVTYTGNADASANYNWNFSGATVVSGSGMGPYQLQWTNSGPVQVSLIVDIAGCMSAQTTETITLEPALAPLTINCLSSPTEITFEWDDVTGATGYTINVLYTDGTMGSQNGNSYVFSGLTQGDSVAIEITTISGNSCPNTVTVNGCVAKICFNPEISIEPVNPVCLRASSTPFNLVRNYVTQPSTSTFTEEWSSASAGITDPILGVFDPALAGAGTHTVTFTYMDDGCTFRESVDIVVFDQPTADFTVDASLCQTEVANVVYNGNNPSANFTWDFDGGTIVSGSDSGPYEIMWSTGGTKTIRLTTEDRACQSEPFTATVEVEAELLPPVVNCDGDLTSVELTWPDVAGANGYTVTVLLGPMGTQNGNSYRLDNLTPGDSVAVLIEAISAGDCPNSRVTIGCLATDCEYPTIAVDPVNSICQVAGAPTVTLSASVSPNMGGTGMWVGPGIVDAANGVFDPNASDVTIGANIVSYIYTEGACTAPAATTAIIINEGPVASIDKSTTLQLSCQVTEFVLDASASTPSNATYVWTTTNGNIVSGENTATPTVNGAGDYLVTVSNGGCEATDQINVGAAEGLPTADAGEPKVITCDETIVTLGGSNTTTGAGVTYTWTTAGGNILSGGDTRNPEVNGDGTYTLTVMDSNTGCSAFGSVEVTLDNTPPEVMVSVVNIIDCQTTFGNLSGQGSASGADIRYEWTTLDGNITSPEFEIDIEVNQPGIYRLRVTNRANGCENFMDIEMVEEGNTFVNLELDFQPVTCFGYNDGFIEVLNVIGGEGDLTYSLDNGPFVNNVFFNSLSPGDHVITVKDELGCTISETISMPEPPLLEVELGNDRIIQKGDSVNITATYSFDPSIIQTIEWTSNDTILANTTGFLEVFPETTTRYTIIVTDTAGCVAQDFVDVLVERRVNIFVPSAFSPNGDGNNDIVNVFGDETIVQIERMEIYDRWGEQMFTAKEFSPADRSIGWDGTLDGEAVNPGVYIYYVEFTMDNGETDILTGDITLIR